MINASGSSVGKKPRQFRSLRKGPEATLQLTVQSQLDDLFPPAGKPTWTAGSVPLGAGVPDILRTAFEPEILHLADMDATSIAMVAYLRTVGRARTDTIAARVGGVQRIDQRIANLIDANIIVANRGLCSLTQRWRSVLPEVMSIEVKVADWRKALSQAARNRIFSNTSYVALPKSVASRIRHEASFTSLGIGLLGIEGDDVIIMRRARRLKPRAWHYYYTIASLAADELARTDRAVQH